MITTSDAATDLDATVDGLPASDLPTDGLLMTATEGAWATDAHPDADSVTEFDVTICAPWPALDGCGGGMVCIEGRRETGDQPDSGSFQFFLDNDWMGDGEPAGVTLARDSTTVGTLALQDVSIATGDCPVSGATVQVVASCAFDPDVVAATTVGRPCE